ncbi:unnamed protein product [Gongylonema pulchrum]|uniref:CBS domain-containing protein n=1 Tax=Gongylonema pulchrum TaxID=637853 RepID=A0A183D5D8_9BILA|nr:unnamed protein product [Gongylonema pulchrum]
MVSANLPVPLDNGDCKAIKPTASNLVEELFKKNLVIPVEDVSDRPLLSIDDITKAVGTGCVPKQGYRPLH